MRKQPMKIWQTFMSSCQYDIKPLVVKHSRIPKGKTITSKMPVVDLATLLVMQFKINEWRRNHPKPWLESSKGALGRRMNWKEGLWSSKWGDFLNLCTGKEEIFTCMLLSLRFFFTSLTLINSEDVMVVLVGKGLMISISFNNMTIISPFGKWFTKQ